MSDPLDEADQKRIKLLKAFNEQFAEFEAEEPTEGGMSVERSGALAERLIKFLEDHRAEIAGAGEGMDIDATLADLRQRQRAAVDATRSLDEAQEFFLHTTADIADATTEVLVKTLEYMERIETLPPEAWAQMPEANRTQLAEWLSKWRGGRKEKLLARLPVELRRRFE